ncbi:hypothetical protein ACWNYI_00580 [Candidatus Vidania fulgoroideorum]
MINKIFKGKVICFNNGLIRVSSFLRDYLYLKKKIFKEANIKIKKGKKVYLKIMGINKKGIYKVSIKEALIERIYLNILKKYNLKKVIKAKLYLKLKNGFLVQYKGIKCFLQKRELNLNYIIGSNMLFIVKRVNIKKRNVLLGLFKGILRSNYELLKKRKIFEGKLKIINNEVNVYVTGIKCKVNEKFFLNKIEKTINIFTKKRLNFSLNEVKNNMIYLNPIVKESKIFYKFFYSKEDLFYSYYYFYNSLISKIKKSELSWLNYNAKKKYMFIKKVFKNRIELDYKQKIHNPWYFFYKNYKIGTNIYNIKLLKIIKKKIYIYKIPFNIYAFSFNKVKIAKLLLINIKNKIILINNI